MTAITAQKFFLMPIPPTPNGRLHLGHIAGPYLRMDMLGRYLRTQGHSVDVVSAVDGFDSYVLWKGVQELRAPEEVVRDYHGQIANDLRALDVEVDDFLDLVQGPYAAQHADNARRTVERLVALGVTETVVERVLYCPHTRRYMAGAWLVGQCPYCQAGAGGYFCEACGALFRPETMQRMIGHFQSLLAGVVTNPECPIGTLPLVRPEEEEQILHQFSETTLSYPEGKTAVDLFLEQVEQNPDNLAVVFNEEKLTYRQLNEQANRLAHHLKAEGRCARRLLK